MSLRIFAISCMLLVAGGTRADYEEDEFLQSEAETSAKKARPHQLGLLTRCAEDQQPTAADMQFCAAFEGDGEACRKHGCRSLDKLAPSGRLSCEGQCNDGSAAQVHDGLSVPEAVTRAVQRARELAEAAGTRAAAKVEAAKQAEQTAMQKKTEAREVAAEAERSLRQAETEEENALRAKDEMQAAMAEATKADAEMNQRSQVYEAESAVKAEKLATMKQELQAKQAKEAEWSMQDQIYQQELDQMKELIPKLEAYKRKAQQAVVSIEQQIEEAKAQLRAAGKKRSEIKHLKDTEGKAVTKAYMDTFNDYVAQKNKVEQLGEAASSAEAANERASSSARSAVAAYWQKVASYRTAADRKEAAKEASEKAEADELEAEFLYGAQEQGMAQALQDQADAEALKVQVEAVYKYAAEFYDALKKVSEPEGGNEMMKVVKLAADPAMKPCLSSYNVVVTAANGIAASNAEDILAELKTGVTQINDDRFTRFRTWCGKDGKEDVARWIWGANGLTRNELEI